MIVDFKSSSEQACFRSDICIIGSGVASLSLARQLIDAGKSILILESGGLDYEDDVVDFMVGSASGYPYYNLDECRLRFFGGTTAIWGGRCAQLNAIDFEKRDWVEYSGWPYGKEVLLPYYNRAQEILDLQATNGEDELWEKHKLKRPPFDEQELSTAFWQFDTRADRFAHHNSDDVINSKKTTVVLHATVTNIQANAEGNHIEKVTFANLTGAVGEAHAKEFVLATGGIENPRLLLAANNVQQAGLGNQNDLVGRFFMEHPHARGGLIKTNQPWKLLRILPRSYRHDSQRYAAVALPSPAMQEREGILNTSFTISARQAPNEKMALANSTISKARHDLKPSRSLRVLWHTYRNAILWAREGIGPAAGWFEVRRGRRQLYTVMRSEQAPNPASRITLGREKDKLGTRRAHLDWHFSDIDKKTIKVLMKSLGSELERLKLGQVEPEGWLDEAGPEWQTDPLISSHPIGGYHHMGTTRMADDPKRGVVDANCKIHGIGNLYVAGSSVFPTSGWANPSLTILALSLKLADHLNSKSA